MEMEGLAVETSVLVSALSVCDLFGDPETSARVGEEYQAVIPTLITESDEILSWNNSRDSFNVGLPLLLMRIKNEAELPTDSADVSEKNVSKKYRRVKKMRIFPEDEAKAKIESLDTKAEDGLELKEYTKLSMQDKGKNEMNQKHRGDGYHIAPGLSVRSWSDLEEASFLLGLYAFGKNLVLVKGFVESKTIGDILSYYYGRFYRNVQYRRWVDGRKKKRRRKCVCGPKIFTGSRQQELLARLHQHVSEDGQSTLLEVSQKFGDGKLSLEDYVFFLKSTVGLNALVDAVGIGKGKKDLTNRYVELPNSSQADPILQEIPTGKVCSSLSSLEIINFLTEGSRLSKARSNDLFWEAVWPRLLARGWHSEQPNDYSFAASSKGSLVFLVPGIKKFSRTKLVKGNHYYDSIADVLKKVVSDPTQLEFDIEGCKGNSNEDTNMQSTKNSEEQESPSVGHHCYLKPRPPDVKVTVVDTSLAYGESNRIIELRSLPAEIVRLSTLCSDSEETDTEFSKKPQNLGVWAEDVCFNGKRDVESTEISNGETARPSSVKVDHGNNASVLFLPLKDLQSDMCVEMHQRVDGKSNVASTEFSNGETSRPSSDKVDHENNVSKQFLPLTDLKRDKDREMHQRLSKGIRKPRERKLSSSCHRQKQRSVSSDHAKTSKSINNEPLHPSLDELESDKTVCKPDSRGDSYVRFEPGEKLQSTRSSRGSQNSNGDCNESSNNFVAEHPRTLIDLNIPILEEAETERSTVDANTSQQPIKLPVQAPLPISDSAAERPPNFNSRRHSVRNRPPTVKALEALAYNFLSSKPKRKGKDENLPQDSMSRPTKHAKGND